MKNADLRPITASRPLVAVVDDDESVRESLPCLLKELGFEVRAFSSAEAFLASDDIELTKCLILDVAMPNMSGLDLLQNLEARGRKIPTILITAQRNEVITHSGAVGCLLKPFSESALLDALNVALGEF